MTNSLIAHVGIAVANLDKSIAAFELLTGHKASLVAEVPDQRVKVAMFTVGDPHLGGRVELVAATSPDSPLAKFIEKRGEGLHHICIYVDNIEARLAALKAAGVKLIDEVPRHGVEGEKIAFVHPSGANGVLVELQERPT